MEVYSVTIQSRSVHKDFESLSDEEFYIECNFERSVPDVVSNAEMDDT